jgi:hypothetical protein
MMISAAILCMALVGPGIGVGMGGGGLSRQGPTIIATTTTKTTTTTTSSCLDCWAVIAASSVTVRGRGGGGDVVGTAKSIAMRRAKTTGMKRGIHLSPFGDKTMTPTPTEGVEGGEEVGMGIGGGGGTTENMGCKGE